MTTPAEIAALAGSAVVGAMATDTWTYVRSRCAALFDRHAPERSEDLLVRLDAYQRAVAAAGPDRSHAVTGDFEQLTVAALAAIAARSADAADAVQALAEEARTAPAGAVSHSNLTYRNIKPRGDFIWSGRDTNFSGENR